MSDQIKAQFKEIFDLLNDNKAKKVSTVLPQLMELMTSKQRSKNFKTDDDGNVTHVFCYYHKEWEEVSEVPYGKKASSATGLASMCKEGVRHWTKQQRTKKLEESKLLELLNDGSLTVADLPAAQQEIQDRANMIVPLGE